MVAAIVALAAAPGVAAPAQPARAVVFYPPGSSTVARRAMTRIREELLAGGFEVSSADPGPRRAPLALADLMEQQEDAVAVVALAGDPDEPGAELWILDRVGTPPEMRRIPVPAVDRAQLPEVLAIRTIEVLKASELKLLLESKPPPPPPRRPEMQTPAPPPRATAMATAASDEAVDADPAARRFGLETGISVLQSVGGPGPAAVPLVRARGRLWRALFARITVAGLGTRPRVHNDIGSSSVDQSLGLGELGVALRLGRRWRSVFSAGGGALRLRSEGEGVSPYYGLREVRLVAAVDAGAGLIADLGRQLSLALEVHGLVALPHPTLRFYDVETSTVGYPAVLASLTLVAWL